MKNISTKVRVFIGTLIAVLAPAAIVYAALNTLNGQSGATQTFTNDTNITISSASNVHTLGWNGTLPISRGGTNASSFESGSIPFFDGTSLVGDFSTISVSGIDGAITTSGGLTIQSDLEIGGGGQVSFLTGNIQIDGNQNNQLAIFAPVGPAQLRFNMMTTARTFYFPDRNGAFALLEGSATSTIKIGDIKSCIVMADSDGSGIGYVTMNDGVLTATTTQPSNCQ